MVYKCPNCGNKNNLVVIECVVNGKMPLDEEGFIPKGNTSEEKIKCMDCGNTGEMWQFWGMNK